MAGTVVLAGGAELQPGCEAMDRQVLAAAGGASARVVFLPTAVARYQPQASARQATAYFGRLGAPCETAMILSREDADGPEWLAMIERGTLIYLAGGDPDSLLDALAGSAAWEAILRVYRRGGVVGGSSAGAMVVCGQTLLPGKRGAHEAPWVPGLDLVPDTLVLPHYRSEGRSNAVGLAARLRNEVAPATRVLGIPEQTALLGDSDRWTVAGPGAVSVFTSSGEHSYSSGEALSLEPSLA